MRRIDEMDGWRGRGRLLYAARQGNGRPDPAHCAGCRRRHHHGDVPDTAFAKRGIQVAPDEIARWRGASKREVVRHFTSGRSKLTGTDRDALSEAIYKDFTDRAIAACNNVPPIAEAENAFRDLRSKGFLLAATTGFGREIAMSIFERLNWRQYFAAMITSDDVMAGRRSPYMIFHAMEAARVTGVAEVIAVGDMPLDLQARANAAAHGIVGVLSGVAKKDQLSRKAHTDIIPSVADLPELVASND